jgi:hypothetical protein
MNRFYSYFLMPLVLLCPLPVHAELSLKDGIHLRQLKDTAAAYRLANNGEVTLKKKASPTPPIARLSSKIMEHKPRLIGVFDFNGDRRKEIFITWQSRPHDGFNAVYQVQVYRIVYNLHCELFGEFQVNTPSEPALYCWLPRTPQDRPAAYLVAPGGATWSTYYFIHPNGKWMTKIGEGPQFELIDLDGDGIPEWNVLIMRGEDLRCTYGFFGPGITMEIFRQSGDPLKQLWPPADWAELNGVKCECLSDVPIPAVSSCCRRYQVNAQLYDIDDDGMMEIIAISDLNTTDSKHRLLEVYNLKGDSFKCIDSISFSTPTIPVVIMGFRRLKDRRQVVLRFADFARCYDDSTKLLPNVLSVQGIDFQKGRLSHSWTNATLNLGYECKNQHSGAGAEDETLFFSRTGSDPAWLLKGIREWLMGSHQAK